jgi:hypothetical protein
MQVHDPYSTDVEFWAPLEGVLKRTNDEVEAIALDWFYQVIFHIHTTRELCSLSSEKSLPQPLILQDRLIQRARNVPGRMPERKPRKIEPLYQALEKMTEGSRTEILTHAIWALRIIVFYARAGRFIVYEADGKESGQRVLTRVTDPRIPFPSLQPKIH